MSESNVVVELLERRYPDRRLSRAEVPEEVVLRVLEAARLTPSCYNMQPWRFVVATSVEGRKRVLGAMAEGNRKWAKDAPLLVVAYSRESDDCVTDDGRSYYQFDLGMAVMNLMLAATAEGLVARPMAGFNPLRLRESLGLDEDYEPMAILAIGYPPEDVGEGPRGPRNRKKLEEIVRFV